MRALAAMLAVTLLVGALLAVEHFVETRTYAEWLREEDREPLELLRAMGPGLELLCEEAIRAALTPQDRRAGRAH